jgi:hypothetical protein
LVAITTSPATTVPRLVATRQPLPFAAIRSTAASAQTAMPRRRQASSSPL